MAPLLACGTPAQAAGGHHAVEDAALLEPRQCQLETWVDRERGGARTLWHAGPACRLGAVEVGLNLDRLDLDGAGHSTLAGVQLKWAHAVAEGWGAGVVVGLARQDRAPNFLGTALVLPLTWQVSETLQAHANIGCDFRPGQRDSHRAGLALEWAPNAWSFVVERFREGDANFWRAGTRWAPTPTISIDLSRARDLQRGAPAGWTLGFSWVLER
ncbi:hypothetical protein [Aquabacterium sp.]|uniref:hypothetical protein n=1 Tax=Aquabacterium sp. TaxID=1872578 RepID=UPI002D0070EC|nr:hypothetical protein [Aquabacterium sp.]HSW05695.1 hypothetical protein [Aquabacterium sp.]